MAYSKSQRKATEKWETQNYEQIRFTVPKGFKARLKESAERTGKSQRAFIIEALEKEMEEAIRSNSIKRSSRNRLSKLYFFCKNP